MHGWSLQTICFDDSDTIILYHRVQASAHSIDQLPNQGIALPPCPPSSAAERNAASLLTTSRCLAIAARQCFRYYDGAYYYISMESSEAFDPTFLMSCPFPLTSLRLLPLDWVEYVQRQVHQQ
jgi:hypothetical protein